MKKRSPSLRPAGPQFDWKQVDSRLVAPKRLTDGMRSWQEKCGPR
jgi:hypothetical protein